jgi:dipeptidyl aminopeptidase/acylaminoacyl peptidase
MRKLILGTALGLMACTSDVAEEAVTPTPTEAEVSFEIPVVTEADRTSLAAPYVLANGVMRAQISPDGEFVAMMSAKSGERQIYVSPSDGSNWEQITDGSGVTFFDVLPSGDILYGSDNNGDERENYFLWNAESRAAKLILPATEKGFRSYGAVSSNGKKIAYASTERNGLDFDIYVMDLESGVSSRVYEGKYGNFVEAANEDGSRLILSESVGEDSDKLFMLDVATGERRVLSDPTPRANHTDAGVQFFNDETLILATNRGREFAALTQMKLATGEMSLLDTPRSDVDVDTVKLCGERILYTTNWDGFSGLMIEDGDSFVTRPDLPRGVYGIDCNDNTAILRVSGPDIPGDVLAFDLTNYELTRIYTSNYGQLDKGSLITPDSIRMRARDGVEVQGLLYMPEGESDTKPPVVFLVHGGPTAQARPSYNPTVQYLLSRGIAVFQTNVRGSTGFGRTYTTLDDREKRLDSIRDLVDMLESDELAEKVDTERAAVVGGSYGGYAVNAVLSEYPDAFVAGVSLYGVADWVTALEIASPALKASDLIEYGDINDPKWREFYTKQSPIRNADKIKVPVLFSHGAMDPRIDIAETEVMVRALRANGIDAPYIRYPDEGHGWRKLDNQLTYQRRQAEFLEEVLGVK